ncbi:serine/threonine-protein phosphatase 4 regulatory subunit 1-like isoform X3 [Stegodyphus dumicola]|uniref:serine/threonine-protein phosphatase 4 regulatory subunit 1-like isoform X3 n=1 Tax=Stegodyphus dumicola TaxID=202533 RepID=UPI0015B10583|nr:serine/threonine-protein phosphatase 4 regulatory subunit 1-like isoform X3 [Stegodyphus dumicola]
MSFADIFITEQLETCADGNHENNSDVINEPENSKMTLKQSDSDSDHFSVDDSLVNPDDLLPPVEKLEKYAESDIVFNRQVVARNLLETLRLVHENQDEVARVLDVLSSISEDYDPAVRIELVVQLPNIAAYCKEAALNFSIQQYLVPMLISYLGDENSTVRQTAHSALISLIEQKLIDTDTVSKKFCPLILHLTENIHPEDIRTESIVLMSKLAVLLGKDVAEELFLDRLFSLCADKANNVRKACASTFGDFCTTVGRETTEELLLPKFVNLCEDQAWCVRKACTENFMPVSCVVSRETRCNELATLYMYLLSDQSRWVRLTAYQALGPFISTFAEPDKTGLYYSKDGVLTVVDVPYLPAEQTASEQRDTAEKNVENCSTVCENSETSNCNNYSSLDRTNSSKTCDSVVPLCSTEAKLSASEIPGNSCHVGNYCTVIEVNSSNLTSSTVAKENVEDDTTDCLSKKNGIHCDSEHTLSNKLNSGGDSCSVVNSQTTIEINQKCHKSLETTGINFSVDEKEFNNVDEKGFNKFWYEFLFGPKNDSIPNGDLLNDTNGEESAIENHLDSNIVQNGINSEVESASLRSVTVNGISISSSAALSGPTNCEVIPVLSCNASVNENTYLKKSFPVNKSHIEKQDLDSHSIEIVHSIENICSQEQKTDISDIPSATSPGSHQESSCLNSNQKCVEEVSIKFKVNEESLVDESAFNSFQYWRTPLPDVEIDAACKDCNVDGAATLMFKSSNDDSAFYEQFFPKRNIKKLDDSFVQTVSITSGKSNFSNLGCTVKSSEQTSENKEGEPPPSTKQLSVKDQDIVPPDLLSRYLNMTDATWAQTIDAEIARHCAYSLPAVALTLGRRFWPCLKEAFDALSSDLQGFIMMWKVRRTVASSMHQLAVILGPDITSRDLLPVFSRFITDLDEVRVGILQHMYEFLKVLRPEERRGFLPSLPEFLVSSSDADSNEKNWRFRLILAEQLVLVADLFEPEDVREHLVPLTLTLIRDKICEVRRAAVRVMAAVMKRMSQSPTPVLTKAVLTELAEKFVQAPKWLHRQLYVYICQEFVVKNSLPPDQFAEDALPQLLYLCWDRVPNVRIAIARCLAVYIWPLDTFSNPDSPHRDLLLQTIHTLQCDSDADVRFYANMVSTHECSCLQHGEFANLIEPPV